MAGRTGLACCATAIDADGRTVLQAAAFTVKVTERYNGDERSIFLRGHPCRPGVVVDLATSPEVVVNPRSIRGQHLVGVGGVVYCFNGCYEHMVVVSRLTSPCSRRAKSHAADGGRYVRQA